MSYKKIELQRYGKMDRGATRSFERHCFSTMALCRSGPMRCCFVAVRRLRSSKKTYHQPPFSGGGLSLAFSFVDSDQNFARHITKITRTKSFQYCISFAVTDEYVQERCNRLTHVLSMALRFFSRPSWFWCRVQSHCQIQT